MVLGNAVALAQTSMKRMLAYSSIAQAGFVLIGLIAGTEGSQHSALPFIYLFMNLGGFTCVILFTHCGTTRLVSTPVCIRKTRSTL